MKTSFSYYDGYVIDFEYSLIPPEDEEMATWTQFILEDSDDFCYERNGFFQLERPGVQFIFTSKQDLQLFITRTELEKTSEESLTFYEKFSNLDLTFIREQLNAEKIDVDPFNGVVLYRLPDGKFLSADLSEHSGELYQNEDEYKAVLKSLHSY